MTGENVPILVSCIFALAKCYYHEISIKRSGSLKNVLSKIYKCYVIEA